MEAWSVAASSGGRYPAVDPVFFSDRQRVALVTALALKLYQLNTKQMIAKIAVDGSDVAQLCLSKDESTFYLLRKSGFIEQVGVYENAPTRVEVDAQFRVRRIVRDAGDGTLVVVASNNKGFLELGVLNLAAHQFESWFVSPALAEQNLFGVSAGAKFAAFAVPKAGTISVLDLTTKLHYQVDGITRWAPTVVAVSDTGLVAVGNTSGVINLWYAHGSGAQRTYPRDSVRTLKWHLDPVRALMFTLNDEYLLSGGMERVLVFWQMQTNKQQFLPRLDAPIISLCANGANTLYGVTLADSQLVVLSAVDLVSRLHVSGTKAHFAKVPPEHQAARRRRRKRALDLWANSDYTTPLEIHPGTRHAYLYAGGARFQAFNVVRDDQEAIVTLARTLSTGRVRGEQAIEDAKVTLLKFTPSGDWMVSVDAARTGGLLSSADREVNLKFWRRDEKAPGGWSLSTRVTGPHGPGKPVLDCVVGDNVIVTAASDGSLRQWRLAGREWTLRRIMAPFAALSKAVVLAASHDDSVMVLAHDTMVYLVDPRTLRIVRQLPNLFGSEIRGVVFVGANIAVLSKTRLVMFDLTSLQQRWAIALKVPSHGNRLLAADPYQKRVALAVNYWTPSYRVNSRLVLWDTASPVPLESYTHASAVAALARIPGTSSYYFLDVRGVLCTLAGSATVAPPEQPSYHATLVSLHQARAAQADAEMERDVEAKARSLDVNAFGKVFDAGSTNIEQLFERVLTLVSPLDS